MWFRGLAEYATVIKSPTAAVVELGDGGIVPYAWLLRLDAQRYAARYGAASVPLHDRAAAMRSGSLLPVAVVFDVPSLTGLITSASADRTQQIRAAIAAAGAPIATNLAEHGFVERARSRSMPVIFGALPAGEVSAVAHHPSVNGNPRMGLASTPPTIPSTSIRSTAPGTLAAPAAAEITATP